MKTKRIALLTGAVMVLALAPSAFAQDLAINWHTIDGGGGFSSGGGFGLAGTIGQPDAGVLTGGDIKLVGGFGFAMAPPINTPPGINVDVQPVDETTGQPAPVTMTFDEVLTAGDTTVTSSEPSGNDVPPQGFIFGDPPVTYDISTTATFDGEVEVCFDYSGLSFTDDQNLRLFHSSDGIVWDDITSSLDTQNDVICGFTSSFSFFGVFETVDSDGDGLLDATEYDIAEGSGCPDPSVYDSDGDMLSDGAEVELGTDPCNPDTDNDGLRDDVDPDPLVPDQTGGALEQDLRVLADVILTLDLGLFNGPNNNANRGRRNALANRATDAANALAADDIATAIDEMSSLLDKIDGQSRPPDWMDDGEDKDALADDVLALIAALEGP